MFSIQISLSIHQLVTRARLENYVSFPMIHCVSDDLQVELQQDEFARRQAEEDADKEWKAKELLPH